MFNFATLNCDTSPQNNVPAFFFHLPKRGQNGQQNKRVHGRLAVRLTDRGLCIFPLRTIGCFPIDWKCPLGALISPFSVPRAETFPRLSMKRSPRNQYVTESICTHYHQESAYKMATMPENSITTKYRLELFSCK